MDFERIFNQSCEEKHWDIVNDVVTYLMKTDEEYKNNSYYCADIIDSCENLKTVLEENKPIALNEDEISKLIEYINKSSERNTMERKHIFYAGLRYAYFSIKEIGLLKETNIDFSNIQKD